MAIYKKQESTGNDMLSHSINHLVSKVDERIAIRAGLQLHHSINGQLDINVRQILGPFNAIALPHQLHGAVHVSNLTELAIYQPVHLVGEVLGGKQNGRRGEAGVEIGQRGLAHGRRGAVKVQYVIYQLEGTSYVLAVAVGGIDDRIVVATQQGGALARVGHEAARLVEVLPEVVHHPLIVHVAGAVALHHLSADQMLDDGRHGLHHLHVAQARQVDGGPGQQVVPGQDGHLVAKDAVDGGSAPAGVGAVDDVVVEEGGRVDHFGYLGQPPLRVGQILSLPGLRPGLGLGDTVGTDGGRSCRHVRRIGTTGIIINTINNNINAATTVTGTGHCPGEQHDHHRPDLLPPVLPDLEEVRRRLGQDGMVGVVRADQIALDAGAERVEVGLRQGEGIGPVRQGPDAGRQGVQGQGGAAVEVPLVERVEMYERMRI
mmetsp:Transcript_5092/g.14435  ORF Transcript_5092/g.14435 Transcript_5092/m.14435 type:complete len:431 (-) Transcript_5092:717-2009(-)